jgi:hypothetical protein
MGLFSRSSAPKEPRPVRASRPRIRLRAEELKASNRLTQKEKMVGFALAGLGVIGITIIAVRGGVVDEERWRYPLIVVGLALFGVCVRYTNRMGASFGACGALMLWTVSYPREFIVAYPLMGYLLYLTFASSRSRQKIMADRAAAGDFANPADERRAARSKPTTATEDATGRQLASKSKRYTPPKAKPKN